MHNVLSIAKTVVKKVIGPKGCIALLKQIDYAKKSVAQLLGSAHVRSIISFLDRFYVNSPFGTKLQKEVRSDFKIGMAILVHERPEVLALCLDSLFKTNLYNYDITFLIQDDGSTDGKVLEIIEKERDSKYKIIRSYTKKGHNSWGAAFNKAMRKLMEIDNFDIMGSCDGDAFFHPEWLDQTMKVSLWAKKNHKDQILGPFSSFNSSDFIFHKILGAYESPFGRYVVKERMGALNYFYFREDFIKLGFFEEHKDDETLMTDKFRQMRVRNFCTETSYIEHIGRTSILDNWRPTPVGRGIVYGMNLVKYGWPYNMESIGTLGYYKFIKNSVSTGDVASSQIMLDVVFTVAEKDIDVLPYAIDGVKENLKHPIARVIIIAPAIEKIKTLCRSKDCQFICEDSLMPITKKDINYTVKGLDRSGWLYQQFLKLSVDSFCSQEYCLIIDADTILISPQVFEVDGKTILLHSDEHHQPYFDLYRKLFYMDAPSDLSFVSHHILLKKTRISELKKAIENRFNDVWFNIILSFIDKSEISAFSEYEMYGQWMLQNYEDEIIREYWQNKAIMRQRLNELETIKKELAGKYRSISFHSYMT